MGRMKVLVTGPEGEVKGIIKEQLAKLNLANTPRELLHARLSILRMILDNPNLEIEMTKAEEQYVRAGYGACEEGGSITAEQWVLLHDITDKYLPFVG